VAHVHKYLPEGILKFSTEGTSMIITIYMLSITAPKNTKVKRMIN
jgi:hypothetical protein